MATDDTKTPDNSDSATSFLVTTAAAILGAAAGAKIADDIMGGNGLPSALAQLGGAILGGVGGKALADAIRENEGKKWFGD